MKQLEKTESYAHQSIEIKWQKAWESKSLHVSDLKTKRKPYYNLMMFPYPSAEGLHVGNMYAFTGSDIFGRYKRMQGYEVFEPIGLDGFGIHSENYALKIGRHPMDHARMTEKNFYAQLHKIGAMFDWSRTVETYDTDYYRWTQWLFVQMFKRGLAYRGKAEVNWCPDCKTVLADEQVVQKSQIPNSKFQIISKSKAQNEEKTIQVSVCERCGNTVEKRLLEQWFFRITAYAEKLLENSFTLDWSDKVKVAQKNWIGKKEGINITYNVVDMNGKAVGEITCFTTRPDTNFGATFVVIAPEHPFVSQIMEVIDNEKRVTMAKYVIKTKSRSDADRIGDERKKTGAPTGLFCINQLNGYKMPLYVSDFVLMGFGTGAVVGVPGHDVRDFEFAQTFHLPVIRVVKGTDGDISPIIKKEQVQEENGVMTHSGFLDGLEIHKAIGKMMDHLEQKGWGKRVTTYHLRDWLISRQRYWGPPIPMIHCKTCLAQGKGERHDMPGWYSVPESQLPVLLPRIEDYKPGDDGVAPLAKHKEFYQTTCSGCGGKATRETDVSDTFLDSSWYFLRYPSVNAENSKQIQNPKSKLLEIGHWKLDIPWDPQITRKWLPVDMYTGGAEHSVLHLMYSRFVTMALKDWGFIDFEEPFTRFYAHGLVIKDGVKMSKSKGNVVNPDEYIALYGADALRLYLMFMGPYDQGGDFRDTAMEGMSRWVGRVWRLGISNSNTKNSNKTVISELQKLIKKITDDIEKRRYNTAIASMMEFTNLVNEEGGGAIGQKEYKTFLLLFAPFAPHLTEELWFRIQGDGQSIHQQSWPVPDTSLIQEEGVVFVVQINGKLRDTLKVDQETGKKQNEVEKLARVSVKINNHLAGKHVIKVIFVSGKLLNFVVST